MGKKNRNEQGEKAVKTRLERIMDTSDIHYRDCERLYLEAFPADERRSAEEERRLTDTEPHFHPHAILHDGRLCGLANTWHFAGVRYIEHLAIEPAMRAHGIASDVLTILKGQGDPIILEVEPPDTEEARRRIAFYEHNGFRMLRVEYEQPYEDAAGKRENLKMDLMVWGEIPNLDEVIREIQNS